MPLNLQLSPLTLPEGTENGALIGKEKWKANRRIALQKIKSDPVLYGKWCEERRLRMRKWKNANREKMRKAGREYYARLKERAKTDPAAKICLDKRLKYKPKVKRVLSQSDKIKRNAVSKILYNKSKSDPVWYAEMLARGRQWRKKNRETVRRLKRDWENSEKNNPTHSLKERLRGRMRRALSLQGVSGKCDKTISLLGCDPIQMRKHIESLFLPGMTWENRSQWHIDHIRPCSSFDLTDPEQQRCCFHFSNLQPLWAADNIKKSNKWPG